MTHEKLSDQFQRLSTGIKMLAILSLALLPLGVIALLASLQTSQNADQEHRADVRIALLESTRKLGVELASDMSAMRFGANKLAQSAPPEEVCARLTAIFAAHSNPPTPFAVFGPGSQPICATQGFAPPRPSTLGIEVTPHAVFQGDAIDIIVPAKSGNASVVARYSTRTLAQFARPMLLTAPFAMTLANDTAMLSLASTPRLFLSRTHTASTKVGVLGLALSLSATTPPFGAAQALLAFLPLVMWASAAAITFFLADRLLLRPLRALRAGVANHVAGTPFAFSSARTPSREIRDLEQAFAQFDREIAVHQSDLAAALADQTRATREVHHRVKNNLQVVASLISLHARSASSPDAATAYAAIQRRVDALAIVHRNHYAELDTGGRIELRGLVGELATNLRASANLANPAPPISVTVPPVSVTQDTAIAIGFLLTELIELSMTSDATAPIAITVTPQDDPGRAQVAIASDGLRTSPALEAKLASQYARILEGLARQLRSPMVRDDAGGRFAIEFATQPPNIGR